MLENVIQIKSGIMLNMWVQKSERTCVQKRLYLETCYK